MSESNTDKTSEPVVEDRKALIDTAVRFLKNPKVIQTPESNKREFLAKKGMTESEISESLKQANAQVALVTLNEQIIPSTAVQLKPSIWLIVFKWIKNFLFAGCLAFTAYKLIIKKYYVAKKNKLEITIEKLAATNLKLNESIIEMKQSLNNLKTSVESIAQIEKQNPMASFSLENMRSEVQTIKNLLLNRSQFPSIPTTSPILPSWQLESKNALKEKPAINTSPEKNDEIVLVNPEEKKD